MTMTREELIDKEAEKYKTDENDYISPTVFKAAVEWADKHPKSPWMDIPDPPKEEMKGETTKDSCESSPPSGL